MSTKPLATVTGTMLTPGVSRNNRLYTKQTIGRAVERMRQRLSDPDGLPIVMRTHHDAGDDSRLIVGRITGVDQDAKSGAATYAAELYDNSAGRDIAALVTPDKPALRSVSIHGYWLGEVQRFRKDGAMVEAADDLEIDAVDFTASPGVAGAKVTAASRPGAGQAESHPGRVPISESVEATVTAAVAEESVASVYWIGEYNAAQLRTLAARGQAMVDDDGNISYPIKSKSDLRKAIRAVGRGGADHNKIRKYIAGRAAALGLSAMVPANWKKDGSMTETAPTQPAAATTAARGAVSEAYVTVCVGGDQGNIVQVCVDGADSDTLKKAAKKAAKLAANFLDGDDSGDGTFNVTVLPDGAADMDDQAETVTVTVGGRRLSEAETRAWLTRATQTTGATSAPAPAPAPAAAPTTTPTKEAVVSDATTAVVETAAPTRTLTDTDLATLADAFGKAVKEAIGTAPKAKKAKKNRAETSETTTSTPAEGKQKAGKDKAAVKEAITPQVLEAKLAEERTRTIAAVREQLLKEQGLPGRKGFRHVNESDESEKLTGDDLWNRRKEIFAAVAPALYAGTEVGAPAAVEPEVPAAA